MGVKQCHSLWPNTTSCCGIVPHDAIQWHGIRLLRQTVWYHWYHVLYDLSALVTWREISVIGLYTVVDLTLQQHSSHLQHNTCRQEFGVGIYLLKMEYFGCRTSHILMQCTIHTSIVSSSRLLHPSFQCAVEMCMHCCELTVTWNLNIHTSIS